ncbi:MAG: MFS transporter [Vicinamibacterales bacterium]|jgi:UMF1 family MFS transporter|nr:MFS transporter [Vicinamibacterales bacterium]
MSAPSLLERVGLHRPELRAWAMYDWANSAFMATVVTAVFPIYFPLVAAAELDPAVASFRFASTTFIALSIVAVLAPVLGAIADVAAVKKKMLAVCLALGVVATACMFFIGRGDWMLAAVLFILANIGATASFVFYDSLLPHIAGTDEMDRVSTSGYALGYLGGGVLLVVNLVWILRPEWFGLGSGEAGQALAMRLSFVSVAVWWVGFSLPLFRTVPEPARALELDEQASASPIQTALVRLGETLRELRGYKQAFLMMLAFLVYNDGIGTIIRMATTFGTEIGLEQGDLITAIMLVQFVGVPFAFIFGQVAVRIGAKRAIFLSLAVYVGISILSYGMTTAAEFYTLAMLVGMVQGGSQALSRSLFASMVPRHKSSEFFGFFGVFEKFAGIVGPGVFAVMILVTGSSRGAILSIIAFFVVGGILLARVDVEEGQRVARDAEADLRTLENV